LAKFELIANLNYRYTPNVTCRNRGLPRPRRWRQQGPPKQWCPTATLYGISTHRISTWLLLV